jgi:uncharacterized SAM-binding protein YcdF (DUF218 family)
LSRRWLRPLVVFAVLALVSLAVLPSALSALGRWLVVADPIDKASAIVVHVGRMPFRAMEAATFYNQGWAPAVWLTQENRNDTEAALLRLAIQPPRDHEYSREVLLRSGVPASAIRVLAPAILNTVQEVDLIAGELRKVGGGQVILVTSKSHSRRVRSIWWARVGGSPKAIVRYATEERYDPALWWRRTRDMAAVSWEVLGLVNVWAGFPLQADGR